MNRHLNPRKPWLSPAIVSLSLVVLAGCGGTTSKSAQAGAGPQAIPVAVAAAERRDVPVYLEGLGSVQAYNTVSLKSRVDGQIVQIAFKEGQFVKQGDLLIVIDPRPYQVQLEQAEAALARDQAQLKNAQLDYDRYQGLVKDGVIAQQQFDAQKALVNQLQGTVQADQATIDNAKLQLVYSRITAPVSGRIGLRLVDIGNMVHATDTTALLVITQLQPIAVVFTLPEDSLPAVAQHMRSGALEVDAYSRDDSTRLAAGKLLTIDNQIDPTTGTGKLKAIFENHDNALWPDQFVNAHFKTVEIRQVKVALTQANISVVDSGLAPGDMVVTDGQDKLQGGSRVEPHNAAPGAARKPAQTSGTMGQ